VQRADVSVPDVALDSEPAEDRTITPIDVPRIDTDQDGLCDDTELGRTQTDPNSVDSDGDGFTDLFEYLNYTNANRATDPNADSVIAWYETPGELAEQIFSFTYRGVGETLFALYSENPPGIDGLRGNELGLQLQALAASPPGNVVELTDTRFVSVTGQTRLTYRFSGAWPTQTPLRCRRAYTITPIVYSDVRGYVYGRRFFVDVRAFEGAFDAAVMDVASTNEAGPRDDLGAQDTSDVRDARDVRDASPSVIAPWPYVSRGLCQPRPGPCI
jgi:hypothetical protein